MLECQSEWARGRGEESNPKKAGACVPSYLLSCVNDNDDLELYEVSFAIK